jgi:hypothetical protein
MPAVVLIGTAHIGIPPHARCEATPSLQPPATHLRTAPPGVASMSVTMEKKEIELGECLQGGSPPWVTFWGYACSAQIRRASGVGVKFNGKTPRGASQLTQLVPKIPWGVSRYIRKNLK